jgi:protocatechuate 3,4-dioxygenase beta subunit
MKNISPLVRCCGCFFVLLCILATTIPLHAEWNQANLAFGGSVSPFTVTGTVKNNEGTPFDGAEVQAIEHSTGLVVTSALTNSSGAYSLSVVQGTYDVKAIPPAGSGFTPTILLGQTITGPTIIDFVLVPAGTCTLSGQITDRDGNPVRNQPVELASFTSLYDTTDSTGNYSFTATPGTYSFRISSPNSGINPHLPAQFYLWANDLSLTVSTILNIQLPNVSLTVTVQDLANNPVSGTTVSTELALTSTTFGAGSVLFHGNIGGSGVTDTAGQVILWMFPTTTDVKISPLEASGFAPMRLDSVSIQADTAITVHLIPTITLSGQITDRDGSPVVNQPVELSSFTTLTDTTDASGHYSFTASPGTYSFHISSPNVSTNPHLPAQFYLWANDLSFSVDTILNIRLPNVSLTVTVLDPANDPVPGTTISTELALTSTTFNAGSVLFHGNIGGTGVADTAGRVILWMFPTTTDVKISPPEASGFAPMRFDSVTIQADTAFTVHLIPTITLSGRITDRDGSPVHNQPVELASFTSLHDTTDVLGNYSFTASPGVYSFRISPSNDSTNLHIPAQFYLWANDLSLSVDTILNVQLPNVSLTVTVLDLANNPIPGATISTELALTSTTFNAGSVLFHGNIGGTGVTDTAGKAILWMFPTTADVKISPSKGSGFAPIKVDSVVILSDMSLVVHIEQETSVRMNNEPPAQFALLQNYPNPFNPTTTIEYALPVSGFVTINVFDILGREVAVLVNEHKAAGVWHKVTFDLGNLPAGAYFYHMQAGTFHKTRKLVLLK